jgi:hypothetical protein
VVELGAGIGAGRATTAAGASWAPFLFASAGAALAAGPGELAAELRFADLRYDDVELGVEGNALGWVLSAGYRLRL